jgi:hypothetical protein
MALASLTLGLLAREVTGRLPASVVLSVVVFLLAIPFAGLLGGWCLLVWWIDEPIQRVLRRRGLTV